MTMRKATAVPLMAAAGVLLLAGCQAGYEPVSDKLPNLTVSFADPGWDGKTLPKGQQCSKFGGKGATPALVVDGVPDGTNAVIIEYNDRNYPPLSYDGGHGKIGFWVSTSGQVRLPSVPGETSRMPEGAFVEADSRATGSYATAGYLPPCSGGKGNAYFAEVKAVYKAKSESETSKLLAVGNVELGRY